MPRKWLCGCHIMVIMLASQARHGGSIPLTRSGLNMTMGEQGPEFEQHLKQQRRERRGKEPFFSVCAAMLDVKDGSSIQFKDENFKPRDALEVKMTLADARGKDSDMPVKVGTGAGAAAEKDREMLTTGLWGCFAVFIEGRESNMLVHMTPSKGLGYEQEHLANSMEALQSQLAEIGEEPADIKVTVVSNTGIDEGARKTNIREREMVGSAFKDIGVSSYTSYDVPMSNSAVYFSPENPDDLCIIGEGEKMNEEGRMEPTGMMDMTWKPLQEER